MPEWQSIKNLGTDYQSDLFMRGGRVQYFTYAVVTEDDSVVAFKGGVLYEIDFGMLPIEVHRYQGEWHVSNPPKEVRKAIYVYPKEFCEVIIS